LTDRERRDVGVSLLEDFFVVSLSKQNSITEPGCRNLTRHSNPNFDWLYKGTTILEGIDLLYLRSDGCQGDPVVKVCGVAEGAALHSETLLPSNSKVTENQFSLAASVHYNETKSTYGILATVHHGQGTILLSPEDSFTYLEDPYASTILDNMICFVSGVCKNNKTL
jgi:hypothetical protein